MADALNNTDKFLTLEEETELHRQFVKDNFCPFDEDPFVYEHEGDISLMDS